MLILLLLVPVYWRLLERIEFVPMLFSRDILVRHAEERVPLFRKEDEERLPLLRKEDAERVPLEAIELREPEER